MGDIWEKDITRIRETSQRLGVGPSGRRPSTCSPATPPSPPAAHPSPGAQGRSCFLALRLHRASHRGKHEVARKKGQRSEETLRAGTRPPRRRPEAPAWSLNEE